MPSIPDNQNTGSFCRSNQFNQKSAMHHYTGVSMPYVPTIKRHPVITGNYAIMQPEQIAGIISDIRITINATLTLIQW